MPYRIAIVGAGGVGGYFGGRLAVGAPGVEVIFLLRDGEHARAIAYGGLTVDSTAGPSIKEQPCQVLFGAEDIGVCDAVLVCVKAYSLEAVAPTLKPLLRTSAGVPTVVLPLLNGVGAVDVLCAALGAEHVVGGLCYIFAWIDAPGRIKQQGPKHDIAFGELNGSSRSARVDKLSSVFTEAGIVHTVPPAEEGGIRAAAWDKFASICALSGVGAVSRVSMGSLLAEPRTRALFLQVVLEGYAVGRAHGVMGLSAEKADKLMTFLDSLDGSGTASMQRDMMAGRVSELHAQLGEMVARAEAKGVEVPAVSFIFAALLPQERHAEAKAARAPTARERRPRLMQAAEAVDSIIGRKELWVIVVSAVAAVVAPIWVLLRAE